MRLLAVILDGVGYKTSRFGNAFKEANTPNLDRLEKENQFCTINAHGTYVGMPSQSDLGNSEVGHNAIGAGRLIAQGASLVENAIHSKEIFQTEAWNEIISTQGAFHCIGLLSDGNVHSHERHLHEILRQAKQDGIKKVFVHALLDGRDVGEKTAEIYLERLHAIFDELNDDTYSAMLASGGGRMVTTMDRYEADWSVVENGWKAHVDGISDHNFSNWQDAMSFFRKDDSLGDQYIPSFVISGEKGPIGKVSDGDCVLFFNFRGDRAIEICEAFEQGESFSKIKRPRIPKVKFFGMMEYDGDRHIPKNFLVPPPIINDTLSEYLISLGKKQFACSETQKFGHMTFFWNGNRSGYLDENLETYKEIPSDRIQFDQKPEMKAKEITGAALEALGKDDFDFVRINIANGDMVGHTGNFEAAKKAMEIVDVEVGKIDAYCKENGIAYLITADHGNCEEMFNDKESDFPKWPDDGSKPSPKTSHTLNRVPVYLYDPSGSLKLKDNEFLETASLANLANTFLDLMDLPKKKEFLESILK